MEEGEELEEGELAGVELEIVAIDKLDKDLASVLEEERSASGSEGASLNSESVSQKQEGKTSLAHRSKSELEMDEGSSMMTDESEERMAEELMRKMGYRLGYEQDLKKHRKTLLAQW